jgi:hypothetical protein
MSLSTIFAAINAAATPLLPTGVTFGEAGSDIFAESNFPRVVWVPIDEQWGPAAPQGGDGVTNPRPLFTRQCNVQCTVWGADQDTVEAMINALTSTIHEAITRGSYLITRGNWLDVQAINKAGAAYVMTVVLLVPVTHTPDPTATITSIPNATQVITPYGS